MDSRRFAFGFLKQTGRNLFGDRFAVFDLAILKYFFAFSL